MKKIAMVMLLALVAAPVMAEDLSKDALGQLGLAGMQQMSDEAGQQVRGANLSMTGALSTISGVLFDPDTKSFVNFAESDFAMLEADLTMGNPTAFSTTGFSINISLVGPNNTTTVTGAKLGVGLNSIGGVLPSLPPILP